MLEQLIFFAKNHQIHIIALQETHLLFKKEDGTLDLNPQSHTLAGWTAHFASAVPTTTHYPRGGCGFIVHPNLMEYADPTIIRLADGTLILNLNLTVQKFTLINTYVPHAGHQADRAETFHLLATHIHSIPSTVTPIVLGDLNSILPQGIAGPFGPDPGIDNTTIDATAECLDFMAETGLTSASSHFNLPYFTTYEGPSSIPSQPRRTVLDHILVPHINIIKSIRTEPRPIPSTHFPVIATLHVHKPRYTPHPKPQPPKLECRPLYDTAHPQLRLDFVNTTLSYSPKTYEELQHALLMAAALHLSPQNRPTKVRLLDAPDLKQARLELLQDTDYSTLRNNYRALVQKRKQVSDSDVQSFLTLIEQNFKHDPLIAYHALRKVTFKPNAPARITATDTRDRLSKIASKCASQLQNPLGDPTLTFSRREKKTFNVGPFTVDEIQQATAHMSRHKATGPDEIPTDFLKIPELQETLCNICNGFLSTATTPDLLRQTQFAMIPKPGANHTDAAGWRYIALMNTIAKLYDALLLHRIRSVIDPLLHTEQNGFRAQRNTQYHILALQLLMDKAKSNPNDPLWIAYIDFSNAFPSVTWTSIRRALEAFHTPGHLIQCVLSMYADHNCTVRTTEGHTPTFKPTAGVLQGDTLAPYLFVIVLDCILHDALRPDDGVIITPQFRQPSKRNYRPARHCSNLAYADDIALTTHTAPNLQNMLTRVSTLALRAGLAINVAKTKYMTTVDNPPVITVMTPSGPKPIEYTLDYRYLGRWTDVDKDNDIRIGQAWARMKELNNIWRSAISPDIKIRLWRALVLPILTYGPMTYPLTVARSKRLRGAVTRMLRRVHNLPYGTHATLEALYGPYPQITTTIIKLRARLLLKLWQGPEQPALLILKAAATAPEPKRGSYLKLLLDDFFLGTVQELIQKLSNANDWLEHADNCAEAHEDLVKETALYNRQRRLCRTRTDEILRTIHLPQVSEDAPLIEHPAAQIAKCRTLESRHRQILQLVPTATLPALPQRPRPGQHNISSLTHVWLAHAQHRSHAQWSTHFGQNDRRNICAAAGSDTTDTILMQGLTHVMTHHMIPLHIHICLPARNPGVLWTPRETKRDRKHILWDAYIQILELRQQRHIRTIVTTAHPSTDCNSALTTAQTLLR